MDYSALRDWVNINSGTDNLPGLARMADALVEFMSDLPFEVERISVPEVKTIDGKPRQSGDVLRMRFYPDARIRVLFSGHMDTVYGAAHSFQELEELPDGRIRGPGVADMKGGLFIMLNSVKRFLNEDSTGILGGEILINADEEVGSAASMDLLLQAAKWNTIGLVFESSLPGGELVRCRKGTGTFKLSCHGKAAHTGRDFDNGRNAVAALASVVNECHALNETIPDSIVNVANFSSTGPVNVVPDYAEAWLNIRIGKPESIPVIKDAIDRILKKAESRTDGIKILQQGEFLRPPKVENETNACLHEIWNRVEEEHGYPISGKRDTGGSSDGNVFGAAGLPHLDGVGIVGGEIHSENEFAWPDSIARQIDKTVGFLHALARRPELFNNINTP